MYWRDLSINSNCKCGSDQQHPSYCYYFACNSALFVSQQQPSWIRVTTDCGGCRNRRDIIYDFRSGSYITRPTDRSRFNPAPAEHSLVVVHWTNVPLPCCGGMHCDYVPGIAGLAIKREVLRVALQCPICLKRFTREFNLVEQEWFRDPRIHKRSPDESTTLTLEEDTPVIHTHTQML